VQPNQLLSGTAEADPVRSVLTYLVQEHRPGEQAPTRVGILPSMTTYDMTQCQRHPCPENTAVEVDLPHSILEDLLGRWGAQVIAPDEPFCYDELRVGFTSYQLLGNGIHAISAMFADMRGDDWMYVEDATFLVACWYPNQNRRCRVTTWAEGYTPSVEIRRRACP
jgi:hypothetical protein